MDASGRGRGQRYLMNAGQCAAGILFRLAMQACRHSLHALAPGAACGLPALLAGHAGAHPIAAGAS